MARTLPELLEGCRACCSLKLARPFPDLSDNLVIPATDIIAWALAPTVSRGQHIRRYFP
jgi:hypothetical protein